MKLLRTKEIWYIQTPDSIRAIVLPGCPIPISYDFTCQTTALCLELMEVK